MKIRDEHLYRGAVLNQIAEHPRFTAINTIEDRDICCLAYKELTNLLEERRTARGQEKDHYQLLITAGCLLYLEIFH